MKYIIYCRKSTDEKDKQVLSIDQQLAELHEFARREHLDVVEIITEAKTAKAPGRERFAQVLKLVEGGVAQGILSWHPDRLARNSVDGGRVIYLLDTGKLHDLKFPTFWFDNTPQGKFMLNIAFGQSKYYVDNLSQNVVRGMRYKIKNGIWAGRAPLGYINDPKTRTIEVDVEKVRIIKKAFQLFAQGDKSFIDISNFLKTNGITGVKGGKSVKIHSVRVMLSNRFYVGIMKWAGEYYEGNHKQFISRKLFNEVQKQIERRCKPQSTGHIFPFRGFIKCGQCGASITAEVHKRYYKGTNRHVDFTYYRCTKKLTPCTQQAIRDFEMENFMKKVLKDIALPQSWKEAWFQLLEEDEKLEKVSSSQNLGRLELELQALEVKLNKLLDGYLEGIIDGEIYKTKKNELFDEKVQIQEDISRIKSDGSSWLEPFKEFIENAFSASKIARAKNTDEELVNLLKTVGSNFVLDNRRILLDYKKGFKSIQAEFDPQPNSATLALESFKVTPREVESRLPE